MAGSEVRELQAAPAVPGNSPFTGGRDFYARRSELENCQSGGRIKCPAPSTNTRSTTPISNTSFESPAILAAGRPGRRELEGRQDPRVHRGLRDPAANRDRQGLARRDPLDLKGRRVRVFRGRRDRQVSKG